MRAPICNSSNSSNSKNSWSFDLFIFLVVSIGVVLSNHSAAAVNADDWPHWRGPNRNDRSTETGLMQEWPEEGPPQKWLYGAAGEGYAGLAIADGRLYTMGMDQKKQFGLCIDAKSGQEI